MTKDPYRYFRIEARELLDGLNQGVLRLEKDAFDPDLVTQLLRLAHTLKGAARVVKQQRLAELAHALEDILVPCREARSFPRERAGEMFRMLDEARDLLARIEAPVTPVPPVTNDSPVTSTSASASAGSEASPARSAPPTPNAAGGAVAPTSPAVNVHSSSNSSSPSDATSSAASGVASPTSNSAASAVQPSPAPSRLDTLRVEVADLDLLTRNVAETSVKLSTLRRGLDPLARAAELSKTLAEQLDRASGEQGLLGRILGNAKAQLEQLREALEEGRQTLVVNLEHVENELDQLRDHAQTLRLLPASNLFANLERVVRDVAETEGKSVNFASTGGGIKVDAYALSLLNDALVHVARNAVSHGIEAAAERTRSGKPPRGSVQIDVQRRGRRVSITCRDDGRGIDTSAVLRAAVARGLISAQQASELDREEILHLVLQGGLTTRSVVTEVSGRGVGLEMLGATVKHLKGDVVVKSEPGQGASIEVLVPLSVSSTSALVLDAGGMSVSLPLDSVRRSLRLVDREIARTPDGDSIRCEGKVLPFVPLAQALGRKAIRRPAAWSAVVVQSGPRAVAVGVDRVLATTQIVVRPLPKLLDAMPLVSGVSIDAEGHPRLVLDPVGLVSLGSSGMRRHGGTTIVRHKPILVIDDSLTTRMLELSILETAGYEVELAASAEEGLSKAQAQSYSLFVVDVEMPGMDGFQFVERTRKDPVLQKVPAVLVTSRCAPEDFRKAEAVGASGYIVKGEFDQDKLLQTIRRLLDAAALSSAQPSPEQRNGQL